MGLPFSIGVSDIVIPDCCPVLGIALDLSSSRRNDATPSVDRIEPEKGYVKGNIRVVSWRCNRLKSDATATELNALAEYASGK